MNDSLPDYSKRKALVEAYGWNLLGWPGKPIKGDSVLLCRWEDAQGIVVAPPPTRECNPPRPGMRQHLIVNGEPHQTFLRLPYFAAISLWEQLLFEHLARRAMARVDSDEPLIQTSPLPHTNSL